MPASEARQPRFGGTLPAGQPPVGGVGSQHFTAPPQRPPYDTQGAGVVSVHAPPWQLRLPQQPVPASHGEFCGMQYSMLVGPLSMTPESEVFLPPELPQAARAAATTANRGRSGSAKMRKKTSNEGANPWKRERNFYPRQPPL